MGRKLSDQEIQHHILGARKKMVYCYDYHTKELITTFLGQRIMARELNINRPEGSKL